MPPRRRTIAAAVAFCALPLTLFAQAPASSAQVERWDVYELKLSGPSSGNPFTEVRFSAEFHFQHRTVDVPGFYDGSGTYIVRFMPDEVGEWTYTTHSSAAALDAKTGRFTCGPARVGNHGPVAVSKTFHFAYADDTPYYPIGTTCYGWSHQSDELEQQTLDTLRHAPFNKMRMLLFPHYARDQVASREFPYVRDAQGREDYTRFNPEFFRHQDQRIRDLRDLGIEADLILLHPYGNVPYMKMPAQADDLYVRYAVARYAAFRNVWWSLANEYDFLRDKTMSDWDRLFRIVQESDPFHHLRSIHNSGPMYDHTKPWVTHVSVQSHDFDKTPQWLAAYQKPVVFDECQYEGDSSARWGNLSGEELARRFWLAAALGAYAGHSETYVDSNRKLWLAHGGRLLGDSVPRIAFLRKILEETGPLTAQPEAYYPLAGSKGDYYLYYFDYHQPASYDITLPVGARYKAELIDPWQMTIIPLEGTLEGGKSRLKLPRKPYMAVRIRKVKP